MNKKAKVNASILIIGNEILSGRTQDTNTSTLAIWLNSIGVNVAEVRVIPDIQETIVDNLNFLRSTHDYVFTTGGIGPTHDDITALSISKALSLPYEVNKFAKKMLENHYSDEDFTKARLKMAYMPRGSSLIENPVSVAPGFFIKNIYVFPGVPKILEVMIDEFFKKIDDNSLFFKKTVSTILSEGVIGEFITNVQNKYKDLDIGSYPYFKKNSFGVSIVISGDDKDLVDISSNEVFKHLKKKGGKPRLF